MSLSIASESRAGGGEVGRCWLDAVWPAATGCAASIAAFVAVVAAAAAVFVEAALVAAAVASFASAVALTLLAAATAVFS